MTAQDFAFDNITISGKVGVGSTTLSKALQEILGWKYINAGQLQREYDREHNINEHLQGAMARSDEHEKEMEERAKKILQQEKHIIYEAWLSGFVAREMENVFRVLVICSNEAVRVDRVVNRENTNIEMAKQYIRQREEENVAKWKAIYGDYDFWDPKYYHFVIDTYGSGPMETVGKVLDKLGYKNETKP